LASNVDYCKIGHLITRQSFNVDFWSVVGMSLLLAVTVYQLILTDELPSSSEALPLIGTLMLCYDLILVTCR